MANRFVDNVTLLNADTLNQFEDDVKQSASIPVYNAVFEEGDDDGYKAYRISEVEWNDIPVGKLFTVIFNQSTQSEKEEIVGLRFGAKNDSAWFMFYSSPDYGLMYPDAKQVKTGMRKYLQAGRPYTLKKLAQSGSTTPLIVLLDHFDTSKLGSSLSMNGEKMQLKNLDGNVISEVSVTGAALGTIQIQVSGSTLNIIKK